MYEIVFDAASERRFGGAYVHIHRGDLHTVLEHAVAPGTIAFDHQLVDLEEKAGAARLIFANGASTEADIVIGADGIRSKVRDYLLGAEPPRFSGAAAYRAIFPAHRLNGLRIPDCTKWWGTDRHCLPYYLTGRRDEVYAIGVVPVSHWDGDEAVGADHPGAIPGFVRALPRRSAARVAGRRRASACGRSTTGRATIAGAAATAAASCSWATPVIRCRPIWPRAAPWRSRTPPS